MIDLTQPEKAEPVHKEVGGIQAQEYPFDTKLKTIVDQLCVLQLSQNLIQNIVTDSAFGIAVSQEAIERVEKEVVKGNTTRTAK